MADRYNNNNPIEHFFRQKAREYNIQYREEDWLKLEERLNEQKKQRANRRRRWFAAAAVALLFSVLAYFTYQQQMKISKLNEKLSTRERLANLPSLPLGELPGQQRAEGNKNSNEETTQPPTGQESPEVASEQSSESDKNSSQSEFGQVTNREEKQQEFNQMDIVRSDLVVKIAKASPGFDGRFPAISAIRPSKTKPMHPAVERRNQPTPATSQGPGSEIAPQEPPRISLGVLFGPDLSTAGGMSNFSKPGHTLGITVEYHLNRNFSIAAGARRSQVRYIARGSEYQQQVNNQYSNYPSPSKTTAECVLIDIPVTMKYTFAHFQESRFYATAGLSSYIMLDEKYRFDFDTYQSGAPQQLHRQTATGYWISNATISIGYEVDLLQSVSVRAEPFMKVPIKGVGLGDVNLYSIGSFVSLNYNIK